MSFIVHRVHYSSFVIRHSSFVRCVCTLSVALTLGFIVVALDSCSSAKTTTQTTNTPAPPTSPAKRFATIQEIADVISQRSTALNSLKAEGSMAIKTPALSQRVTFDGGIFKRDSLLLNLYGPLGITVGKLQSTSAFARFYFALDNSLYEGEPSRENFLRRAFLPVSYDEIVTFLRGEVLGGFTGFNIIQNANLAPDEVALVRQQDSTVERVLFSTTEQAVLEYQRKSKSGDQLMLVRYSNFITTNGVRVAQDYSVQLPPQQSSFQAQCSSMEANVPMKYTFSPSSSAVRKKF